MVTDLILEVSLWLTNPGFRKLMRDFRRQQLRRRWSTNDPAHRRANLL